MTEEFAADAVVRDELVRERPCAADVREHVRRALQRVAVDARAVRADDDVRSGDRGGLAEITVRFAVFGDELGDLAPDAAGFLEHIRGALIRMSVHGRAERADDGRVAVDHDRGAERGAIVRRAIVGHEFLAFGPDATGLREDVDRAFPVVDVDGADQRGRAADRDGLSERVMRACRCWR